MSKKPSKTSIAATAAITGLLSAGDVPAAPGALADDDDLLIQSETVEDGLIVFDSDAEIDPLVGEIDLLDGDLIGQESEEELQLAQTYFGGSGNDGIMTPGQRGGAGVTNDTIVGPAQGDRIKTPQQRKAPQVQKPGKGQKKDRSRRKKTN